MDWIKLVIVAIGIVIWIASNLNQKPKPPKPGSAKTAPNSTATQPNARHAGVEVKSARCHPGS